MVDELLDFICCVDIFQKKFVLSIIMTEVLDEAQHSWLGSWIVVCWLECIGRGCTAASTGSFHKYYNTKSQSVQDISTAYTLLKLCLHMQMIKTQYELIDKWIKCTDIKHLKCKFYVFCRIALKSHLNFVQTHTGVFLIKMAYLAEMFTLKSDHQHADSVLKQTPCTNWSPEVKYIADKELAIQLFTWHVEILQPNWHLRMK